MHDVDTVTGCDGGAETVVVIAVGAAVLVAAVVVGMREIGRAAEGRGGRSEV